MVRMSTVRRALAVIAALVGTAHAEVHQCHVIDVDFTPAENTSSMSARHEPSQIVVWLEDAAGNYLQTLYITAQTGRFGLGNRPGRWDFNSGPLFPYGHRVQTFPVWAHRKPERYPAVIFQNMEGTDPSCVRAQCGGLTTEQCNAACAVPDTCDGLTGPAYTNCGDNDLSHPSSDSSSELHFCRPLSQQYDAQKWQQADAMTCATVAFTDKGKFSTITQSLYPPRLDLVRNAPIDSPSVDMYKQLAGFDAISHATPAAGTDEKIVWPLPQGMPGGNYVVWVEVSQAFDMNGTYNPTTFPAPSGSGPTPIAWSEYGLPYRGQPSVVYKVPFTIDTSTNTATTDHYVGYGDPTGGDGNVRAPDATITTDTPGSGGSRLELVSEGGAMYRVRVVARPEFDYAAPGAPEAPEILDISPTTATVRFVAPGDDGEVGKVSAYDVRYLANRELTEANFDEATRATATLTPGNPGELQTLDLSGLLPETDYWIGIRAADDCYNVGPLTIIKVRTADRQAGAVDACFIATAAYGSLMANDVEALRHFRDAALGNSVLGELAIETYYTFGPPVAGVVGQSELLRALARDILQPIVEWVRRAP